MAERITPGSLKLSATFAYMRNGQSELKVIKDNAMVLQLIEVSCKKTIASGGGSSLVVAGGVVFGDASLDRK